MKLSFAFLALLSVLLFIAATLCHASEEAGVDAEAGSTADSAGDESAFEIPDDAALLKMKVRQLKEILGRKGPDADCLACTSKREYVDRIRETESWPDVTPTPPPPPPEMSKEEMDEFLRKSEDPEYMADLRKKLEEAGIDTKNIFMGNDFDPEKLKKFAADGKENAAEDDIKSEDESSDEKPGDATTDDEL